MTANELARRVKARRCGKYFLCCCPAHDDKRPSLSFYQGHTDVVVHCWAGCDSRDVIAAFRARGVWEAAERRTKRRRPHEMSL